MMVKKFNHPICSKGFGRMTPSSNSLKILFDKTATKARLGKVGTVKPVTAGILKHFGG